MKTYQPHGIGLNNIYQINIFNPTTLVFYAMKVLFYLPFFSSNVLKVIPKLSTSNSANVVSYAIVDTADTTNLAN
jgi:hypothetical protein